MRFEDRGVHLMRAAWTKTKNVFRPAVTPSSGYIAGPACAALFIYTGYLTINHAKRWNFGRRNPEPEDPSWKWRLGIPHGETYLGRPTDFMDSLPPE